MSYKTILVHAEANPASDARLGVVADLARTFDATVVGVGATAFDPPVDPGVGYMIDGETIQALRNQLDVDLKAAETAFRNATGALARKTIWRPAIDFPALAMARNARCADVVVASQPPKSVDPRVFVRPGDLIMETGLPVLVVPPALDHLQVHTVMIAWKNTREARRAVGDALPFLLKAEKVVVVRIEEDAADQTDEQDILDVEARLARHGVNVLCETLPALDFTSEDLLLVASEQNADLIVAGAYGHSRLREWAFGGVTQDLLASSPKPVLFSR